jgi:hypothetical protein
MPVRYSAAAAGLMVFAVQWLGLAAQPVDQPTEACQERKCLVSVQEEKTLSFSGYEWEVKRAPTPVGPGPNSFGDGPENVRVDADGHLHLRITRLGDRWTCAEIGSAESFGYGTYVFELAPGADRIDRNAILGLFTWETIAEHNNREIDIEISRWTDPDNDNCQYVIQPYQRPGNIERFDLSLGDRPSTHSFAWTPEAVSFESRLGDAKGDLINAWAYTGPDLPAPGKERARLNLWLFDGIPPSDNRDVEVVVTRFGFIPYGP